ncbi:hypothetical protein V2G26_015541 [Clonostachys chloroleuca]
MEIKRPYYYYLSLYFAEIHVKEAVLDTTSHTSVPAATIQASHGGFASMDADKQREISSKGGFESSGSFEPGSEKAREAGRKGGSK